MSAFLEQLKASSHLSGGNAAFVEALYEDFLADPASVPPVWREWFETHITNGAADTSHAAVRERFLQWGRLNGKAAHMQGGSTSAVAEKQANVLKLINAYRVRGHLAANLDPLGLSPRPEVPDLDPKSHGLFQSDYNTTFATSNLGVDTHMRLGDILTLLKRAYCRSVGAEYMHISDNEERHWLQQRLETVADDYGLPNEDRVDILKRLTAAEGLEKYLHTKYVGQKRFSLEGAESLISLLHGLIQRTGSQGVKELVMGMAHRGRLNVLVNILGKSPADLFSEFEGKTKELNPRRSGDVKYHLGFSSDMDTPGGRVHLTMGFNPSHLEIIDPVIAGSSRARQTRRDDEDRNQVIPVLIHGDAAFAGQGVIMELFNMSQARGFAVGGTIHIIVNNQIGFTTSNPLDSRSTFYCTEVAKMVQAPIFHVNGDDPEAVIFAMQVASDFRMRFNKDVVIDLVCYRRLGHNEADEPAATQPMMYRKIRSMKTTRELYADSLQQRGLIDADGARRMQEEYRDALDAGHPVAEIHDGPFESEFIIDWHRFEEGDLDQSVNTTVNLDDIQKLAGQMEQLPEGFEPHGRVKRVLEDRKKMAAGDMPMDWGFAETMAYASLLKQGFSLRLVGQDSGRGTFFHRHAVLHDQNTGDCHVPLQTLVKDPHQATIIDSLLSEEAVLGFEYGYASSDPFTLVIWEAQFGDFVNGAQVVIDQFISSGESKWGRLSGLTMFLPHGYEGQGPEHSSARLERFMQLCAQYNMQVCVPTTPAQMFHMLRRQMVRNCRKPLIVMTPKSLLRNKASVSVLKQLSDGRFRVIIPDRYVKDNEPVKRVVLCSGKVFYDLATERGKRSVDVPLIRIEQLYPFPRQELLQQLAKYPNATEIVWCQEEPRNQGAWYQIKHHLQACLQPEQHLLYTGRDSSASPAVGKYRTHVEQQAALVDDALTAGKGTELVVE